MQMPLTLLRGSLFRNIVLTAFIFSGTIVCMQGCGSTPDYETTVQERDTLSDRVRKLELENESLKAKLAGQTNTWGDRIIALDENVQELKAEKKDLNAQLKAEKEAAKATRSLHDDLVADLKSELSAQQVKVDLMKSGIRVSMPGEVLFGSGSTSLTEVGREMLLKVGAKLRDSPYQTVVAGFTDNVPIGGVLAQQYPSNWELAGARAARVVRLLEASGVPSERLIAVSFGENQPVASNDDEEGRARNRRIEIRLRPLE